jgi:hypothetical protein
MTGSGSKECSPRSSREELGAAVALRGDDLRRNERHTIRSTLADRARIEDLGVVISSKSIVPPATMSRGLSQSFFCNSGSGPKGTA